MCASSSCLVRIRQTSRPMGSHNSLLARFDHAEYRLCRRLNRGVGESRRARVLQGREPARRRRHLVRADARAASHLWRARTRSRAGHAGDGCGGPRGLQTAQAHLRARAAVHPPRGHFARAVRRSTATAFRRATRCTPCRSPGRHARLSRSSRRCSCRWRWPSRPRAWCSACTIPPTCSSARC